MRKNSIIFEIRTFLDHVIESGLSGSNRLLGTILLTVEISFIVDWYRSIRDTFCQTRKDLFSREILFVQSDRTAIDIYSLTSLSVTALRFLRKKVLPTILQLYFISFFFLSPCGEIWYFERNRSVGEILLTLLPTNFFLFFFVIYGNKKKKKL